MEGERDTLKQYLDEVQSPPAAPSTTPSSPSSSDTAERLVHEERLKWQLEVAKVRRELLDQLEGERRGWEGEKEALGKEGERLGKQLEEGKAVQRQLTKTQGELSKSQQRLG